MNKILKNILIIILAAILSICLIPIYKWIFSNWIVNGWNNFFDSIGNAKYVLDILIFIMLLLGIFYTIIKWKSHSVLFDIDATFILLTISLVLFVPGFYVVQQTDIKLYKIYGIDVPYVFLFFGFFIFIGIINLVFNYIYRLRQKYRISSDANNEDFLIKDHPIEDANEDILNRNVFVENLYQRIKNLDTINGSRSIAINGAWGDGKTSFINLLLSKFNKDSEFIIFQFKVWHLNPNANITKKFFEQINKKIYPYDHSLSKLIKNYSKILDNSNFSFVRNIIEIASNNEYNLNSVGRRLKYINKKILIILDDIDRLNSEEIEEVFRLIRGSANIPNFIYISCFDKKYVETTLNLSSKSLSKYYIEKFYETEYILPAYDKKILEKCILMEAKKFLLPEDYISFEKYIRTDNFLSEHTSPFIILGNLRGIYRWLNNINLKYKLIKGECKIEDLADIELLSLAFPNIYETLRRYYNRFLINENGYLQLWTKDIVLPPEKYFFKQKPLDFYDLEEVKSLNQIEREKLQQILNRLLPIYFSTPEKNSFRNPNYIDRYFFQVLQSSEISQIQFNTLIKGDFEQIKNFIDNDIEGIYSYSLYLKLKEYNGSDKKTIDNIIKTIFYATVRYNNFGFDLNYLNLFLNKLFDSDQDKNEYIKQLSIANGFSRFVCSLFSYSPYSARYLWNTIFTPIEMDDIMAEMLRFAINEGFNFNDISHLYHMTHSYSKTKNENGLREKVIENKKADEIFKDYIAKNFIKLLPSLVWHNHLDDPVTIFPSLDLLGFWKDWEDLEQYCISLNISLDSPKCDKLMLEEFKDLWDKYNNFNKPIKNTYKTLK